MDWNAVTPVAAVVAAVGGLVAALLSFMSWSFQRANYAENEQYKARLSLEERYFKLHLLWQELRIAAVMLQHLPTATADFAPRIDGLPTAQITEALATKDLLAPDAATRIRIARDDLVEIEQLAGDGRNPEYRKMVDFARRFPELLGKTIASLEHARQAIMNQLPG